MVLSVSENLSNLQVIKAEEKLSALVEFIRSQKEAKILVFFSTCKCVEYMKNVLTPVLKKRQLLALHGKKKNGHLSQVIRECKKKKQFLIHRPNSTCDLAVWQSLFLFNANQKSHFQHPVRYVSKNAKKHSVQY